MKKNSILAISLLLILLFQIAFLNNFDYFLLNINIVIVAIIFLLNTVSFNKLLVIAILFGLVTDIFSSLPFGVFLATYCLTVFFIELLFLNFFTNNSFYSILILGIISILIFNLIFFSISGFLYLLNLSNFVVSYDFWIKLVWQIIDTSVLTSICFYLINNRSRIFKPVFLRR